MEELEEIYEHYFDKYEDSINYEEYYNYLAEREDLNWEDNI